MGEYTREELDGLLALYAMDALPDDEARAVEAELARRPELWDVVDEHRATLGELTEPGPSAPEHVWQAISATIGLEPAGGPDTVAENVVPLRPAQRQSRWIWTAAVAASVVAIAAFGLGRASVGTTDPLLAMAEQVSDAPGTVQAELTADGIAAKIVLAENGAGYLMEHNLPALDRSRTYQLWAVTAGGVTSAGVLGSDPGLVAFHTARADEVQALVITEENAGGVVTSEGTVIAAWGV